MIMYGITLLVYDVMKGWLFKKLIKEGICIDTLESKKAAAWEHYKAVLLYKEGGFSYLYTFYIFFNEHMHNYIQGIESVVPEFDVTRQFCVKDKSGRFVANPKCTTPKNLLTVTLNRRPDVLHTT
jgi:hypothetical protein